MRKGALLVGGLATSLVLMAAVIAGYLVYYRPTVEYALVNIVSKREGPTHPLPGWALVTPPLAGAAIVLLAYRLLRRNAAK